MTIMAQYAIKHYEYDTKSADSYGTCSDSTLVDVSESNTCSVDRESGIYAMFFLSVSLCLSFCCLLVLYYNCMYPVLIFIRI